MPRLNIAIALAAAVLASGSAFAGTAGADRVHADSFGNLVIHAPGGYKRILVGQGAVADSYNLTGSYYEPAEAVPAPRADAGRLRLYRDCDYDAVILHGRSYMYGLPDGVVPTPAYDRCR